MKGLLLLYGECFREGFNGSRVTDTPTSYLSQKDASLSHVLFCDEMKQKGVDMNILIHTYHTKYETDLRSWYTYPTIYVGKKKYPFKTPEDALNRFMLITKSVDRSYDFILLTRLDILLKPPFYKIINPKWNNIYFFSQGWTRMKHCGFYHEDNKNIPTCNPIIQFIPKKYFGMLDDVCLGHDAWLKYTKLGIKELNFMVDEYHDSTTYLDYNPYYKMVGRPETHIHHDKGKKINRSLFNTTRKIKCKKSRKKIIKF